MTILEVQVGVLIGNANGGRLLRPRRSLSNKSGHCLLLMLFACSGYGEDAITSYNLRLYPNRKHSRLPCFSRKIALFFKRTPFTLQKDSFCNPKRTLLQPKRTPFEKRRNFKGKGKREKGKINWIFYPSKTKNDTNPRLPPCSCRPY